MNCLRAAKAGLTALTLAGCAGGSSLLSDTPPAGPEIAMPGRWILSAPNAPVCGMNFSGSPGKNEGTVSPEGGCPERFFTSRHWALDKIALTISDDENNMLATLNFAGGRFEGRSVTNTVVTLAR